MRARSALHVAPALAALFALCAAGCTRQQAPPPAKQTEPASAVGEVLTQRSSIEAGKRAADTIKAVSAERNRDMEGVLKDGAK